MGDRWVGIDVGAETVKLVELRRRGDGWRWTRRETREHHEEPGACLRALAAEWDLGDVAGAAVSGRGSGLLDALRVPVKQAQAEGARFLHPEREEMTVVSIGGHGFSVLELRASGVEVMRSNSRCSQGTGNFLRQLVGRFDLDIETASTLAEGVEDPAPLSGRCPVILKTDMTHLANKGTSHARILAGLYDAVCENVQVLVKPRVSPPAVLLAGGVCRSSRVRASFERYLTRHDMELLEDADEGGLYLDALGAAVVAADRRARIPPLERLVREPTPPDLPRVGALADSLAGVRRMTAAPPRPVEGGDRRLILGFDIGSTGSKAVALDLDGRAVWESYLDTNGNPVGAAQGLVRRFTESELADRPVIGLGATGSGREIVGSMLATCHGPERVTVLNEIAAHAEGALSWDPRVDTIFEIGGQDAKYIRLSDGRVIDAAMNEACSAGTGSFIEEQGKKFSGIESVVQLGQEALRSEGGVSLGQHCSVFMAEVIDGAVAAGVDNRAVIAGIYDSIVQNYLNRVKGNRSVGQVVFCQGMPFASDALAAAVVRQTGSEVVVPPNPGTVGALGIALLTRKAMADPPAEGVDLGRFLDAAVVRKDTFVCKATRGCGGSGNRCRIDRIQTRVGKAQPRFTWGGSCSLWDKGTGKRKLPDLTPDPFREREEQVAELLSRVGTPRGRPRIGMTDEFQLKGLFPFFATFLHELGFDVVYAGRGDHAKLKRGIEQANVPFCAPMQLYHGVVSELAEQQVDLIFAPMLRELPRVAGEKRAVTCPIVQASPDILRWDLGAEGVPRMVSPVIDVGASNLASAPFLESCQRLAAELGVETTAWWSAFRRAREEQRRFDDRCLEAGRTALAFCREHELVPVVVLGRPYTIYNPVLSSNVPPLLREQGALAIPVDCYPVDEEVPALDGVYWGYGQRSLRAAHQIRRTPGVYSLWCSNYSCGPDSFNLHFYAHAMEGKPFAVIETDGHAGDAGTKTRIEAFLHCVREDLRVTTRDRTPNDLLHIDRRSEGLDRIRARGERLLIPRMGDGAEAMAACLRGIGVDAEVLPQPDREALDLGRRHTSGKECVPMCITLGSLLQRLEREREGDQRFAFFMPTANGPCRFGVYNMLHRTVLSRLGWSERVSIWSPNDADYFEGLPPGFAALVVTGFAAHDMLAEALYHVRPVETRPGAAQAVHDRYRRELLALLEATAAGDLSLPTTLLSAATGRLFGCADLLRRAALDLRAVRSDRQCPTVMVVGEIYVRCDPFANDFVIDKLERHGLRVRFAPFVEWLEYSDWLSMRRKERRGVGAQISTAVQKRIVSRSYEVMARVLGWPERTTVEESLAAAAPYIRDDLAGEAVLTLGGPVHEHRHGLIDGVVSVGPLECMPNKIAETQLFHVAEREGLASLTLPLNGDPLDPEVLSAFAFEARTRFERRPVEARGAATGPTRQRVGR